MWVFSHCSYILYACVIHMVCTCKKDLAYYYKPIIISSCCMQLVIVIIVQCLNNYVDKPLGKLMINTRNKLNLQLIILCRITYWSYISHNYCKDYNLSKLLYLIIRYERDHFKATVQHYHCWLSSVISWASEMWRNWIIHTYFESMEQHQ